MTKYDIDRINTKLIQHKSPKGSSTLLILQKSIRYNDRQLYIYMYVRPIKSKTHGFHKSTLGCC